MKNNLTLILLILFLSSCSDNNQVNEKLTNLEKELAESKSELATTKAAATSQPGLIHNVFFWLKKDISPEAENEFLVGLKSIGKITTVKSWDVGPPAATEERGVVDNSFSYALLLHFDDENGQSNYQVDPIHLKFVEDHKDKWERVVVYDNLVKSY